MSLLMDALKQAEQNKHKGETASSTAPEVPVAGSSDSAGQDQPVPMPGDPLFREEDRAVSPPGEEAGSTVMSLPPPADETGADDDEVPLADELDFSEIEAAIAAEERAANPDPPRPGTTSPGMHLETEEAVEEAPAPTIDTTPVMADTAPGTDDGVQGGRSFGSSDQGSGQGSETPPEPAQSLKTADDAARLIAAGSRRRSRARKRQFMLMGVLFAVVLAMTGAYYYWSYQLHVQPVTLPAPLVPAPVADMDIPARQAENPEPVTQPVIVMPRREMASSPEAVPTPRETASSSSPPARTQVVTPPREKPPARKTVKKPTVADKPAAVVIERHAGQPSTYQMLTMAYQAYREDRIQDARRLYEKVLDRQPRNRDALLGLASVAVRQGRNDEARALYRRQLEADPKDGIAQTGLLSLLSTGDPVANESLIKQMLREHGETPYLRFALGNVYAAQSRWEEAQQSYFRAYSAAPQNANYLFNLAVSLDHLHQDRMALQYYRWAVSQAGGQAVKFDVEGARQRIRALTAAISGGTS
ncbi:MAG TPA: tetratricopeptide repeat protein [Gammaproteobacteria bacterium]|nr:tetratricopeptide repeat protein [Gammaproteobacteria bacterium]